MMELTIKQEDFLLEQARDNRIEQKQKCAFCREKEGTELIVDGETIQEILICKDCDWLLCLVDMGCKDIKADMGEMDNPKIIELKTNINRLCYKDNCSNS